MAKEQNLILDNLDHAKAIHRVLKARNVSFEMFHPKGDLSAYKFVFDKPLPDDVVSEINRLADSWYQDAIER